MMQEIKRFKMMAVNKKIITETLGYFRWHNLHHDMTKLLGLIQYLSPEEAEIFDIDLRKLNFPLHAKVFMYGVGKYYSGLDILSPMDPLKQVLKLNSLDFNHDIKFALKATTSFAMKDLGNYSQAVLNGQKFQNFLELCFGPNAANSG